jgi:hypothetical protein
MEIFDRFKSPNSKRGVHSMTEDQLKALVNEVNRPIIEPLLNPPRGYQSSLEFTESDLPAPIRAIKWFSRCGMPITAKASIPIRRAVDWGQAIALSKSDNWENTELEAQNQLTIWLCRNVPDQYQKWNDFVRQHKVDTITPIIEPAIKSFCRDQSIDESILNCVQWDILGALMENSYLYTGHKVFFFLELVMIYQAGHFPCGWTGRWPDGELYVW